MIRQDYLDTLDTFVHDPSSVGFDDNIIPVAMWLRGYMPGDDDMSPDNMSSAEIQALLCDIVSVEINAISRLMVMNGYSLGGTRLNPAWRMQRIE